MPVLPPVASGSSSIRRIDVEDLLGKFSYELEATDPTTLDLGRLMILYGDNGTGKTTILRSLFHLLSGSVGGGHKTALAHTQFKRIAVTFTNGLQISAQRETSDTGPFSIRIQHIDGTEDTIALVLDEARDAITPPNNPGIKAFLERMNSSIDQDIYYIDDSRQLFSDNLPPISASLRRRQTAISNRELEEGPLDPRSRSEWEIIETLDRAAYWLRQQVVRASNVANQNTNAIYTDVVRRIAIPSIFGDQPIPTLAVARERLLSIGESNDRYQKFELVPQLDTQAILQAVDSVPSDREPAFISLLVTFLDSLESRILAVSSLYDALDSYVEALNSFYRDKTVEVSMSHGIEIHNTSDGEKVNPGWLSSGERQLLLILTNSMFAHERPGIFLIDEPELSLNMKWQRRLVEALLSTTRGTTTQFVLASHSFEIMAGARERVVHLTSSGGTMTAGPLELELEETSNL
jgi:predicted ATPase